MKCIWIYASNAYPLLSLQLHGWKCEQTRVWSARLLLLKHSVWGVPRQIRISQGLASAFKSKSEFNQLANRKVSHVAQYFQAYMLLP